MSRMPVVAIVHLASPGATGSRNRVASLRAIFEAAGAEVTEVPLLREHRVAPRDLRHLGLRAVARAESVPEVLAWSARSVRARLDALRPAVVVCVTARAYRPEVVPRSATVVLDYVDRLSDSYRDRATIVGRSVRAPLFRVLAATSARFERRPLPPGVIGIAAGWTDATALGLTWIPITVAPEPEIAARDADHDVLFLGKLSYPPNIEGIRRLAQIWPEVRRRRPTTTLLLAGATPTSAVVELARSLGWTVMADFDDLAGVVTRVRLAASPLTYASGIQTKVLSSAAFGLAQVLTPVVAGGFAPGFPARVADTDAELVEALVGLLDDDGERARLGRAARDEVASTYGAPRWTTWATEVLEARARRGAP